MGVIQRRYLCFLTLKMEHAVNPQRELKDKQNFVDGQPHNDGHAEQDLQHQEKVLSLGKSYIHNLPSFQSVPQPTIPTASFLPTQHPQKEVADPSGCLETEARGIPVQKVSRGQRDWADFKGQVDQMAKSKGQGNGGRQHSRQKPVRVPLNQGYRKCNPEPEVSPPST